MIKKVAALKNKILSFSALLFCLFLCSVSLEAQKTDTLECDSTVFIRNAFTPNDDGMNDTFQPVFTQHPAFCEFRIYNRWGELIFVSDQPGKGWDGSFKNAPATTDTYIWKLKYRYEDETALYECSGQVMLLR